MLNLGAKSDAADVTKLSDQLLLSTLAQQAKELGIEIDLNYTFPQQQKEPRRLRGHRQGACAD